MPGPLRATASSCALRRAFASETTRTVALSGTTSRTCWRLLSTWCTWVISSIAPSSRTSTAPASTTVSGQASTVARSRVSTSGTYRSTVPSALRERDRRAGTHRGGAVARRRELVPQEAELRGVARVGGGDQVVGPAVDMVAGDRRDDRTSRLRRCLVGDRDVAGPVRRAAPRRGDGEPAVDRAGGAIDGPDRELSRAPGLRHRRQRWRVLGSGVPPGQAGHADHHDGSGRLAHLTRVGRLGARGHEQRPHHREENGHGQQT